MNIKSLNYKDFIEEIKKENRGTKHEFGYEIHHILPKSLQGGNDSNNLVKLTYLEHLVAHYLLARESKSRQMFRAFSYMINTRFEKLDEDQLNNLTEDDLKEFALMKEEAQKKYHDLQYIQEFKEKISKSVKNYFDNNPEAKDHLSKKKKEYYENNKNNPEYMSKLRCIKGRKKYTNGIREIYLKADDEIPEGFYLGRSYKGKYKWFTDGNKNRQTDICPEGYRPGVTSQQALYKEKELEECALKSNTLTDELKYKVNIPLNNLRNKIRTGKITIEEANLEENKIYEVRSEILRRYGR